MNEQKRYPIILSSILFAFLTWLSINLRDEFTVVRQIPVVIENMKEGRALKYPLPRSVSVRFKGNGWQLAGLFLSPDVKYYIDVATLGADEFMITGRNFFEHIKLPVTLEALDVKPDTLYLALDEYLEKEVPIGPRIVTEFREGYGQVGQVQFTPESIRVGGSRDLLSRINGWPTVYRKFNNVHAPLDVDVPLEAPSMHSVEIFTGSTRMHLNVQPFAEKILSGVPVTCTGAPPSREVIFIPPKTDIIVRGGIDQLAHLTNADVQVSVSFQTLLQDSLSTVQPQVSDIEGVQIIGRKPDHFRFIIRKKLF
jgi:YbbR domain-containing protein